MYDCFTGGQCTSNGVWELEQQSSCFNPLIQITCRIAGALTVHKGYDIMGPPCLDQCASALTSHNNVVKVVYQPY